MFEASMASMYTLRRMAAPCHWDLRSIDSQLLSECSDLVHLHQDLDAQMIKRQLSDDTDEYRTINNELNRTEWRMRELIDLTNAIYGVSQFSSDDFHHLIGFLMCADAWISPVVYSFAKVTANLM
jgi:hypothetical protein